jgi:hypothetical protein
MSGEVDRAGEARAITTTTVSTTGGRAGKTAPRFVRVWDYAAARAAETHAVRCAIERGGRRLGVASLARHLRRRATSHAPRLERRRPNLKRRNERDGEKEGFKRCRGALRRRGRMHEVRFKAGESGESYRVTRTHAWHAKRCDDDDDECMFFLSRSTMSSVMTKSRTQPIRGRFGGRWRQAFTCYQFGTSTETTKCDDERLDPKRFSIKTDSIFIIL